MGIIIAPANSHDKMWLRGFVMLNALDLGVYKTSDSICMIEKTREPSGVFY
jgi:hypothetical protein